MIDNWLLYFSLRRSFSVILHEIINNIQIDSIIAAQAQTNDDIWETKVCDIEKLAIKHSRFLYLIFFRISISFRVKRSLWIINYRKQSKYNWFSGTGGYQPHIKSKLKINTNTCFEYKYSESECILFVHAFLNISHIKSTALTDINWVLNSFPVLGVSITMNKLSFVKAILGNWKWIINTEINKFPSWIFIFHLSLTMWPKEHIHFIREKKTNHIQILIHNSNNNNKKRNIQITIHFIHIFRSNKSIVLLFDFIQAFMTFTVNTCL